MSCRFRTSVARWRSASLMSESARCAIRFSSRSRSSRPCATFSSLLPLEPLPDLLARAGRADHRDPVARRAAGGLARDDLDDVAGLELVVEGDDAAVHLRADGPVADVGVDSVR